MAKSKEHIDPIDLLDEILTEYKDLHYGAKSAQEVLSAETISTGSFWFDYKLGGGFRAGTWARFYSDPECGKTSMALGWARNWQEYFLAKGDRPFVVYFNAEGRLTRELIDRTGIMTDEKYFRIVYGNFYEVIYSTIEKLVKGNTGKTKYFFIIDSTDACQKLEDSKKEYTDAQKMAGGAAIASAAGRRLSSLINATGHFLFLSSQIRDKMKQGGSSNGPTTAPSGGRAMGFYSSLVGEIKRPWTETLIFENPSDSKSKQIGRLCEIKLIKTPNETTGQKVLIPIKYGLKGGIWRAYEAMQAAQFLKIYEKSGAWWNIEESWAKDIQDQGIELEKSFQGEKNMRDYFDNHPKLTDYVLSKAKVLLPTDNSPISDEDSELGTDDL